MRSLARLAVVVLLIGLMSTVLSVVGVAPSHAQATAPAVCLVGEHSGVDDADATTAARLVCGELRRQGIDVGEPVTDPGLAQEAYRVGLWRLGEALVLDLSHESPVGDVKAEQRVQITQVEDVLQVAPTIATDLTTSEEADPFEETPPPPPPPPAATTTQAFSGGTACIIGTHAGVNASDAETAAGLVCDELRQLGVSVGTPVEDASGADDAYRVSLRRLGQVIILELSRERPLGTVGDSRSIQLANIEEVTVGARRVARALVEDIPIEDTAERDSLVGEDTRELGEMPGDTYFGLGIVGLGMVGTDVVGAPGFMLKFFYEAPEYGVGSDMLFGGGSPSGDDNGLFFSWSVGAKYFFNPDNIGFFAGGGFAWDTIGAYRTVDGVERDGIDTGVGFYGETGVEFFRFYGSRLIAAIRVDTPFFSVEEEDVDGEVVDSIYIVPISLQVAYAW